MSHQSIQRRIARGALFAGLVAGAATIVSPAFAGSCPADKKKANAREAVNLPASGVTDTVIASIDVAKEPARINDRLFRLRKLVIQPGGVVPWHSHGDRPAIIYIIEGEIHEYASNCAVPIVHGPGDVTTETSGVSHWWKNLGDKPVVLLSADLLKDKMDKHM
jgi:quercetin dioxygenase-like cupin family protein